MLNKTIFIILILSIVNFSNAQSIKIDSMHWDNGELTIGTTNYLDSVISISHFDSLGLINEESKYKIVDSVACFQSWDKLNNDNYIHNLIFYFMDTKIKAAIRIGDRKFYNQGVLYKIINYEPLAFQYSNIKCNHLYKEKKILPCSGGTSTGFLIKEIKYLDESNKVYQVDHYKNGLLESIWNYNTNK